MEDMIPCAVKDREVFQRVWQRVMEGRDPSGSPIQPVPSDAEGDVSCDCLEALMRQGGQGLPPECEREGTMTQPVQPEPQPMEPEMPMEPEPSVQEPAPEPMPEPPVQETPVPEPPAQEDPCGECGGGEGLPPAQGPDRGNDLPQLWEEPQLSDDRTVRLRRHVMDALEGWQFYRHLARRTRGTDTRMLNSMAADQHKEARKLAAAYFLLTGLRYWPTELLGAPAIPSYWGALRTRHQAEQRQENAYRLASDDWEDPDLLALYAVLIEGCQRRSHQLRSLLEQDIT